MKGERVCKGRKPEKKTGVGSTAHTFSYGASLVEVSKERRAAVVSTRSFLSQVSRWWRWWGWWATGRRRRRDTSCSWGRRSGGGITSL